MRYARDPSFFSSLYAQVRSRYALPLVIVMTFMIVLVPLAAEPAPHVYAAGVVGSGTSESCTEAALDSALAGGGDITFNCGDAPHTIRVSSTKVIDSQSTVKISGNGLITISGNNAVRVFDINGGTLTLENLTITEGNAGDGNGGAILNRNGGTLTLNGTRILNSRADNGGGISINQSTATIRHSTIADNSASSQGGGISLYLEAQKGGPLTIDSSTISGNSTELGGAIAAAGSGGGIEGLRIVNTTFASNQANNSGAIFNRNLVSNISQSTFSGNSATEYAAGIFNSDGTLNISNSILSNIVPTPEDENCANEGGTFNNLGGNIQFPGNTCGEDIPTADPLLVPLADNGGATQTMALGVGSPAIDAGHAEACLAFDQRGVVRPGDGDGDGNAVCDIGAYELEAGATPIPADNVVGDGTPASCTEDALRAAVARSGAITFNCGSAPHTIALSNEIMITQDTVINGGGTRQGGLITISGEGRTRVFNTTDRTDFTVRNLTVANGGDPEDGMGGGIRIGWRSSLTVENAIFENNDGTAGGLERGGGAIATDSDTSVTVRDSLFRNNRGTNGGAINVLWCGLTIENSVFENNDATAGGPFKHGLGGAIYTDGASVHDNVTKGQIIIRDSVFTNNRSVRDGGGVYTWVYPPDEIIVERTRFINNASLDVEGEPGAGGFGGGFRPGNGDLILSDSFFYGNYSANQGGAFWFDDERGTLTNVTFVNNRAVVDEETGKGGYGGAIAGQAQLTLINCTIANNHAGSMGGGIYKSPDSTLINTIIANNTAFNDGESWNIEQNCGRGYNNGGNNIQFPTDNSDELCAPDITITDPMLDDLTVADGSQNASLALLNDSPAIDAGNEAQCPATDQRGGLRPADGDDDGRAVCDIGSYEYNAVVPDPTVKNFTYLPLIQK